MNPKARREKVYVEKLANETVAYDRNNHQAYCLNATSAAVWEYADGTRTVDELAALLEEKLQIPSDSGAVDLGLEQLSKAGLMETLQPEACQKSDLVSRRQIASKLGMAGLSAAMLPLVASVLAPTPAMASSANRGGNPVTAYQQQLGQVNADILHNLPEYAGNKVAQEDYSAGVGAGSQGVLASLKGDTLTAQADFQAATSDFDGVLKALGLGPL